MVRIKTATSVVSVGLWFVLAQNLPPADLTQCSTYVLQGMANIELLLAYS